MPNQPADGRVRFELWLPVDLLDRIRAVAKREGESVSAVVRRALELYVGESK